MAGTIIDTLTTIFDFKSDTQGLVKAEHEMDRLKVKTEKTGEVVEFFKRGLETLGIALGVEKINEWANEWDDAQNKLRSTGLTGDALADTMQKLKNSADNSGTSVGSVAELYQQLDSTMGEMVGQQRLFTMVDNLNKVFAINATESGAAKAAMMDMAKGLENTTVNWMEIKRAMQDVPGLANIINKHFREMGTTTQEALQGGGFASKDFVKILIDSKTEIDKQFKATELTVPRSMQHLSNSFEEFFSVLRRNTGTTDFMVDGINSIADAFSAMVKFMRTHQNTMKAIAITLGGIFTALGIRITIAFAPTILTFAAIAAAIAAVVLVVDDLITYVKGGNSVIGGMINTMRKWWEVFSAGNPAIKSVVDSLIEFGTWIGKLIQWFFQSGTAASLFNYVLNTIATMFKILISVIKVAFDLLMVFFEILGNIGKAFGNFAFAAVQAIQKAWDHFAKFREWLVNVFANIGSFLLKPFSNMADIILDPIKKVLNWVKSTSIGKWVIGKLGFDNANLAGTTRNLIDLNTLVPMVPNTISNSTANHSVAVNDNSNMTVNVTVPAGTSPDATKSMITEALAQHKQHFRMGALNNDSRIAR